jgi:dolichol-phosphate hexosyltransferase
MRPSAQVGGTLSVAQPLDEFVGQTQAGAREALVDSLQAPSFTRSAVDTDRRYLSTSPTESTVKLSILMPVYNECSTILTAVNGILTARYPCETELIVVDDGSTDGTWRQLSQIADPRVQLERHSANCGKGAALLTAANLASGTHFLPFDADLEYDPNDIGRLLEPLLRGRAEVVFGARLSGYNTVFRSYWYALGNRFLTRSANILFNANVSDMHTCMKLVPLSILNTLKLKEKRFGLDTELTALLLRLGVRPFEVPISYYSRSHADGKKITWRDGVACLRILLRVRLSRVPRSTSPAPAVISASSDTAISEADLPEAGDAIA